MIVCHMTVVTKFEAHGIDKVGLNLIRQLSDPYNLLSSHDF